MEAVGYVVIEATGVAGFFGKDRCLDFGLTKLGHSFSKRKISQRQIRRVHLEWVKRGLESEQQARGATRYLGYDLAIACHGSRRKIEHLPPLVWVAIGLRKCIGDRQTVFRSQLPHPIDVGAEVTFEPTQANVARNLYDPSAAGSDGLA